MYYDKQIRYIDYLENGEKKHNCGYVKITVSGGRLTLEMQIKGLYKTDDVAAEVVLEGGGMESSIGSVMILQGSGSFHWEIRDPVKEGEDISLRVGLQYGQLERICVRISPRRSLQCVWRKAAAVEKWLPDTGMEEVKEEQPPVISESLREMSEAADTEQEISGAAVSQQSEPRGETEQSKSWEEAEQSKSWEETEQPKSWEEAVQSRPQEEAEQPKSWEETEQPKSWVEAVQSKPQEEAEHQNFREAEEQPESWEATMWPNPREAEEQPKPWKETIQQEPQKPTMGQEQENAERLKNREAQRRSLHGPRTTAKSEDKWRQLWQIYPHIRPFQDEREYLSLWPEDFVILRSEAYRLSHNSFLLHGYYNYEHLILTRMSVKGEERYYIGVPGNFYDKEKQVAIMFGFESFECRQEPAGEGDFGYYMIRVEL